MDPRVRPARPPSGLSRQAIAGRADRPEDDRMVKLKNLEEGVNKSGE